MTTIDNRDNDRQPSGNHRANINRGFMPSRRLSAGPATVRQPSPDNRLTTTRQPRWNGRQPYVNRLTTAPDNRDNCPLRGGETVVTLARVRGSPLRASDPRLGTLRSAWAPLRGRPLRHAREYPQPVIPCRTCCQHRKPNPKRKSISANASADASKPHSISWSGAITKAKSSTTSRQAGRLISQHAQCGEVSNAQA